MMATQIITKERNKMPNWCDTVLTIEGDVNLVSQINEHAENLIGGRSGMLAT
jgi:hypothetical protein